MSTDLTPWISLALGWGMALAVMVISVCWRRLQAALLDRQDAEAVVPRLRSDMFIRDKEIQYWRIKAKTLAERSANVSTSAPPAKEPAMSTVDPEVSMKAINAVMDNSVAEIEEIRQREAEEARRDALRALRMRLFSEERAATAILQPTIPACPHKRIDVESSVTGQILTRWCPTCQTTEYLPWAEV